MVEAPEAPHAHHHKTGLPWFDLIVPIAVLCISVASLLTSLQSEKSMHALVEENRRLVSAQSTPLLMLDSANLVQGKQAISMTLTNVGTGPARIAWFRLVDDWGTATQKTFTTGYGRWTRMRRLPRKQIGGTLMRSGEDRSVFDWPKPADGSPAMASWAKLEKDRFYLHGSACYCSMFEECKVTDFGNDQPRAVDSCDKAREK